MRITLGLALALALAASTARADDLDDAIAKVLCPGPVEHANESDPCDSQEILAKATVAAAATVPTHDDEVPPAPPAPPDPSVKPKYELGPGPHWQRELDARFGSATVDGAPIDYKLGVAIAGGLRFDRLTVLGEYAIAGVGYQGPFDASAARGALPEGDTDGIMHRFGLTGRVAFARGDTEPSVGNPGVDGTLWLEAGAGEEIIDWDKGGALHRPDLALGIGVTGGYRTGHGNRGGIVLGFRVLFAERTDLDQTSATCSAPCTEATRPAAWGDRSYLFDLGITFGD
ncbi:MAG TPA: hypothetical protein VLX92_03145 [Kofleriaceae bacterium]|nr:hypothetical protein [Kofleriaceae bacterium]